MDFNTFLNTIGTWKIGSFTTIDLIAASTNAFTGAILVTRPDHRRNWTTLGIILFAIIGGIAGIVLRDILLTEIPSALTNPWYLIFCLVAALLAIVVIRERDPARMGQILEFMTAFSLPWYAIVGAQKALVADLPLIAVFLISVAGTMAGRYLIDITSGVTPIHFTHGQWFVGAAVLAALLYILLDALGLSIWVATLSAWSIVFVFGYAALRLNWEKPEPWNDKSE
jgi:uncharacterized membrane protein YeiH